MDAVNVDKAVEFILACMNFDGGFGVAPGSESHAGQVSNRAQILKKKDFNFCGNIELLYHILLIIIMIHRYTVVLVH